MKTQKCLEYLFFSWFALLPFNGNNSPSNNLNFSENTSSDPCITENFAFISGEELTYKIYYNWNFIWLSAGEVTFKVIDDDDQFHFQVIGETYDSYNWFFEVKDYFDSWVQKESLLPIRAIKSIKEGKYRVYDDLTFDQSRNKIYNERGKAKDDIRERHNFEVDGCVHDMVSILYYCRNIDYSTIKVGESIPVKIFADKETWPLQVVYKGVESAVDVRGKGQFSTLKFSPEVISGNVFPEDAQVNVWASNDWNRIPLIIESPLSVGSAKAILKSYHGLRYPLVSSMED